jgi:hypothetical protein
LYGDLRIFFSTSLVMVPRITSAVIYNGRNRYWYAVFLYVIYTIYFLIVRPSVKLTQNRLQCYGHVCLIVMLLDSRKDLELKYGKHSLNKIYS